jgi:hypothetical protein
MLKDATYKEKCILLKSWMPQVIESIKKDLKNEHLKNDLKFVKKYFPGKNLNKITAEELTDGYVKAIVEEENAEEIAEFVTNKWLMNNSELYGYFEQALTKISPDFTELTSIDAKVAKEIVDGSVKQFGSVKTYLFSVINSVVFPKETFDKLDAIAKEDLKKAIKEEKDLQEKVAYEDLKSHCDAQIARITDKYEKKLAGLQRKYQLDTEGLKKQIVN